MPVPPDYADRVYAGVLGKLIGVYLGRPIEGWPYRQILQTFGPIQYYVHAQRNVPLVVADDDISGTFTFVRALEDHPASGAEITAEQIGQTWLNYIIENRTILWWGGMGMSTEHTAYLRLASGITAPRSGSMALNGRTVAEQIGAQIFIDGWAMVAPGDPDRAAALASRAASVSHDGEAIYAAQVIAAMEAQAFVERDVGTLLDVGMRMIPSDSVVFRMIDRLREFRASNDDWQRAMTDVMERDYGYDKFGGNCHVIPNHGLIILALLWGGDDFQQSLSIVNTCGWDTDCNSGNVGCLLGIKNGLAGIDAGPDWRGPVADRLFVPTADGGSCITDAVRVAQRIEAIGRRLSGDTEMSPPKNGARFHFSRPGSVQGFVADDADDARGTTWVTHRDGQLAIAYDKLAVGRVARAWTATFLQPADLRAGGYGLVACPTLYPTQVMTADVSADARDRAPVTVALFLRHYDGQGNLKTVRGPAVMVNPGQVQQLTWTIPDTGGQPIAQVGVEMMGSGGASGTVLVDRLDWSGTPTMTITKPTDGGSAWTRAWVEGVSHAGSWDPAYVFRVSQDRGRGLYIHGTRDWRDYTVQAAITPLLASAVGLAARVQGMRRYYALLLCRGEAGPSSIRLIKMRDGEQILAEKPLDCDILDRTWDIRLTVSGGRITGAVDDRHVLTADDATEPLEDGAIAFVIADGRAHAGPVRISAIA